jgi:hypothetical protein
MDKMKTNIREYCQGGDVYVSSNHGRLILMSNQTDIDLRDIIKWVKDNEPLLLEQD